MSIMAKNILEQNIRRMDIGFSLKTLILYCLNSVVHGVFDSNASTSGFICIGVIQGVYVSKYKSYLCILSKLICSSTDSNCIVVNVCVIFGLLWTVVSLAIIPHLLFYIDCLFTYILL